MNMDRSMGGPGGMSNNMDRSGMGGGGGGMDRGMGGMDRGMGRDTMGQGGPHARSRSASRYPGPTGRTNATGPGYHSLDRDRDGYGRETDRDFMPIDRPIDRPRDRSLDR